MGRRRVADENSRDRGGEIDRRRNRVRWRGGIGKLASLIVLAWSWGCSGDSSEGETSGEGQPVENRLIEIRMTDDMRFEPENPVVAVGDTIVWINVGGLPHTTTDVPGRAGVPENNILPAGAATWDSGLMMAEQEFQAVVTTSGAYTYLCTLHEVMGMVGRLTVQ